IREEWTFVRKDGSRLPVLLSITALWDDSDVLMGYACIAQDISEQKKVDERARASEQKFKVLAENIPGAIYLCHNDAMYSMIYLNDKVEEITGYKPEDFYSNKVSFVQLYHPEDSAHIFSVVDKALQEKKNFHLRYRIVDRSGKQRWIEEFGIGVYEGDKLLMIEGFLSDITNQKLAEQKLQKVAEENYRVFNNPVNLNVIAGFDGYFKRVSPTWVENFGWSEQEFLSKPFIDFVHPDDVESTNQAASFISEGNNLTTFENRYRRKDGSYRWMLWSSASDVKNQLIYASAIDITDRKISEEELIHSSKNLESMALKLQERNRQLDEFAHIISHNLRSPVANIQALIGFLNDKSTLEDYRLIFEKLKKVSKNLGETMNDLMDTLKAKQSTEIERVEIRFKEVLDKVVQSLEGELINASASVTFDFNKAATIVYPKSYIESIFQNLLTNSIKYKSPKRNPVIHFTAARVDGTIELRVSDNGIGIDMERFGDKLFGLHKTFHDHQEARGVGLFLIKTQVEAMGGSIVAESEVDKGTTFIVKFGTP
ncbi:MAG: PAS domain-containing sensor histidine kinase, partial [Bacteroidota bacterium]